MDDEIGEEFKRSGFMFDEEEEILKKCKHKFSFLFVLSPLLGTTDAQRFLHLFALGVTFCINYSLKPSDIVSSWEVYYLNR